MNSGPEPASATGQPAFDGRSTPVCRRPHCRTCGLRPRRGWLFGIAGLVVLLAVGIWQLGPVVRDAQAGAGQTPVSSPAAADGPVVSVSIPPLVGIVRALVDECVQVRSVLPRGRSPHGFDPAPSQVAELFRADAVVCVGGHVDEQIGAVLASSSAEREGRVIQLTDLAHAAGLRVPGDGHLWLDPAVIRGVVPALDDLLRRSGMVSDDGTRMAALLSEIDEIDRAYTERLAPFAGVGVLVHHGAWAVLAERYGLRVAGVMHERVSREPTPNEIASLARSVRERHAVAIFTEPQLPGRLSRMLARQGVVELGVLDPLGDGDWLATLRANLDELVATLSAAVDADR